MSKSSPLAYSLKPFNPPHDLRSAAWLPCAKCQSVDKAPIVAWGNNPEKIEKYFIAKGWECNVHKPSLCICPKCVATKKKQAELLKQEPKAKDAARVLPTIHPPEEKNVQPLSHTRTAATGAALTLKNLPTAMKTALRREMDANFDEDKGRYLDGESDHSISERVKIPRAIVAEFRSLSYGEIKEDPELVALRDQLDQAKRLMGDLQARIDRAEKAIAVLANR